MVKEFRSRPDGTKYPITEKKGKGGGVVVAAAVGIAVAASGGGLSTTSLGSVGDSAIGDSIHAKTSKAKQSARKGQRNKAWRQMGLKVTKRSVKSDLKCALNSFGQVQEFFAHTPCRSLKRVVLVIGDDQGHTGLVSIAWAQMRSTRSAQRLKSLDTRDGTGDISTVGSTLLRSRGVRFTGEHYESRRSRSLFVRTEAVPAIGTLDPNLLDGAAKIATYLPRP